MTANRQGRAFIQRRQQTDQTRHGQRTTDHGQRSGQMTANRQGRAFIQRVLITKIYKSLFSDYFAQKHTFSDYLNHAPIRPSATHYLNGIASLFYLIGFLRHGQKSLNNMFLNNILMGRGSGILIYWHCRARYAQALFNAVCIRLSLGGLLPGRARLRFAEQGIKKFQWKQA